MLSLASLKRKQQQLSQASPWMHLPMVLLMAEGRNGELYSLKSPSLGAKVSAETCMSRYKNLLGLEGQSSAAGVSGIGIELQRTCNGRFKEGYNRSASCSIIYLAKVWGGVNHNFPWNNVKKGNAAASATTKQIPHNKVPSTALKQHRYTFSKEAVHYSLY
jgi:hypothetical protein